VRPPLLAASAAPKPPQKAVTPPKKAVKPPQNAATATTAPQPRHKASAPGVAASNKPYYVNVGLFAKPENAAKAHAKLVQAQLPSVAKELKTTKASSLTRVRVGPFKTRQEAQAAVEKIKSLQLDAIIVQP
jgi:cell division protein FtsN